MDPGDAEKFVVKKDIYENCLVLYPMKEWERQKQILREKTNPYNRRHNQLIREYYKGTAEVILDGNNRLLIPRRLLELIDADRELVLAGQDEKIEVWSKERYQEIGTDSEGFANLAEEILGGTNENNE